MTKRILALSLCIVMICSSLFGCAKKDETNPGAYVTMYLTDEIYDFDPANAYYNTDAVNVLSLMYDTLFTLDKNGKIKKSLVDKYKIVENPETQEYYIEFTLKEAYWSVKDQLTAEHVVYAWKRLVDFRNNFDAASLLFDVKNARAIKEGDAPVDDLGVEAVESMVVKVSFDAPIDYDQFLLNLTSVATAPLLERYVASNPDWAKKSSTIATSGAFKLGKISYADTDATAYDDNALSKDGSIIAGNSTVKKISFFYLERNSYYYRNIKHDPLDKSVKPYRLLVDCTKSDADLLSDFQNGKLFYIGNIPLSLRTGENAEYIKKNAEVTNALSTFSIQLNQNALINDGERGSYLFANEAVRQALSQAIDRDAIAESVVFAQAADAFVANGVFDAGLKGEFRTGKLAASLLPTSANMEGAKKLLTDAGIDASRYTFSIKVSANDEIHVAMAEMVCESWKALGFNVTVEKMATIENNDYFAPTDSVPNDVCDDLFIEAIQSGKFEAAALDVSAFSADAYSMLSNYAYAFSGSFYADVNNNVYEYDTHATGYNSVEYNVLMEAIYYIPYFASVDTLESDYLLSHLSTKPYEASANSTFRKFSAAVASAKAALAETEKALTPTNGTITDAFIKQNLEALSQQIISMENAAKIARKDIAVVATDSALNSVDYANKVLAKEVTTALNLLSADKKDVTEALDVAKNVLIKTEAALKAVENAKDGASQVTLKEAIQEIYTSNGIAPSTKSSDWSAQKSELLHKAEELLMKDMPVIPVVYNQNAILVHKDLSRVSSTYYAPATFRKTKLKNYRDFYIYNEEDEKDESIFEKFPVVDWEKVGR